MSGDSWSRFHVGVIGQLLGVETIAHVIRVDLLESPSGRSSVTPLPPARSPIAFRFRLFADSTSLPSAAMTSSESRLAETIELFYSAADLSSDGAMAGHAYKRAVDELDSGVGRDLDAPFRHTVLEPVGRFCSYFTTVNGAIDKRNKKVRPLPTRLAEPQMRGLPANKREVQSDGRNDVGRVHTRCSASISATMPAERRTTRVLRGIGAQLLCLQSRSSLIDLQPLPSPSCSTTTPPARACASSPRRAQTT